MKTDNQIANAARALLSETNYAFDYWNRMRLEFSREHNTSNATDCLEKIQALIPVLEALYEILG